MKYPEKIMKISEMSSLLGFPKRYLLRAYKTKGQKFAHKEDPLRKNSPILFDTEEFEKWRQRQIEMENRAIVER